MRALLPLLWLWSCVALATPMSGKKINESRQRIVAELGAVSGQPLARVSIACDIKICLRDESRAALERLTLLKPGAPLTPERVADAWLRLLRTGLFEALEVKHARGPEGIALTFSARGFATITHLDIEYAALESRLYPKQFEAEIKKRVFLKKGGDFPSLTPEGRRSEVASRLLVKQKRQIVSLYQQQGFEGTRVKIGVEYYGYQRKKVRVNVVVYEGVQPLMGPVLLKGNERFGYAWVTQPITTGERLDFWRGFFEAFDIGRYERKRLKEELKEIEARYRDRGYLAARARLDTPSYGPKGVITQGGLVSPLVLINEGPRVTLRFEGYRARVKEEGDEEEPSAPALEPSGLTLSDKALKKLTTFREAGAVDSTEVENSRLALIEAYQAEGYYRAEVTTSERETAPGEVEITFKIIEGDKLYVRRIDLVGNRAVPEETLLGLMETKGVAKDGVIGPFGNSAGVLQDTRFTNDLILIRDHYRDLGFTRMRFRCAPIDADVKAWTKRRTEELKRGAPLDKGAAIERFDVWSDQPGQRRCFLALHDKDPRLISVRVELLEGAQTTVDRVDIDPFLGGMDETMRDESYALLEELGFVDGLRRWRRGAGLNRQKLESLRGLLLRYYHKNGYLRAQVQPVCLGREAGVGIKEDCSEPLLYGVHLERVRFRVDTGPLTRVNGILLKGNLRTKQHIIHKELLFEDGAPLGSEALFISQANLRSLGIFDAVSVETIGGGAARADTSETTVMVTLEEGAYRPLDAYLGLQLDSDPITDQLPLLYTVGLTLRDRNLDGRALEVGFGGHHANRMDTPTDTLGDSARFEIGPFLKDRRFLGSKFDLGVETTFKAGLTSARDRYARIFGVRGALSYDFYKLSYPATWGQGLRAALKTEYRRDTQRQLTQKNERPPFGDPTYSLSFEPTLTWDRRDSPLHPTRGFFSVMGAETSFNSGAFGEATLEPAFKETLTLQSVHSFFKKRMIIVPQLRLGAVQTRLSEAELQSDFLFKAGGDGVTLPVRGYADASIDACGGQGDDGWCAGVFDADDEAQSNPRTVGGRAMMAGSLEARFDTLVFTDLWGALFADFGAVSPTPSQMSLDRIHPSVGLGLRYLVTGQIPLRLDVGLPLKETAFSPRTPRLHLNLFYTL